MRDRLTFLQDLRYAWRSLHRHPSFSVIAVITNALGMGVYSAVFCGFFAGVMRRLPCEDPDGVVGFWGNFWSGGTAHSSRT